MTVPAFFETRVCGLWVFFYEFEPKLFKSDFQVQWAWHRNSTLGEMKDYVYRVPLQTLLNTEGLKYSYQEIPARLKTSNKVWAQVFPEENLLTQHICDWKQSHNKAAFPSKIASVRLPHVRNEFQFHGPQSSSRHEYIEFYTVPFFSKLQNCPEVLISDECLKKHKLATLDILREYYERVTLKKMG